MRPMLNLLRYEKLMAEWNHHKNENERKAFIYLWDMGGMLKEYKQLINMKINTLMSCEDKKTVLF